MALRVIDPAKAYRILLDQKPQRAGGRNVLEADEAMKILDPDANAGPERADEGDDALRGEVARILQQFKAGELSQNDAENALMSAFAEAQPDDDDDDDDDDSDVTESELQELRREKRAVQLCESVGFYPTLSQISTVAAAIKYHGEAHGRRRARELLESQRHKERGRELQEHKPSEVFDPQTAFNILFAGG
jgi:hypothetical protein